MHFKQGGYGAGNSTADFRTLPLQQFQRKLQAVALLSRVVPTMSDFDLLVGRQCVSLELMGQGSAEAAAQRQFSVQRLNLLFEYRRLQMPYSFSRFKSSSASSKNIAALDCPIPTVG